MRPSAKSPDKQQIYHTITSDNDLRSSDCQHIKQMKENVDVNFKTLNKEAQEIRGYLKNAKAESESMELELSSSFKRLKDMFFYEDKDTSLKVKESQHVGIDSVDAPRDRMAIKEDAERATKKNGTNTHHCPSFKDDYE